MDVGPYHEGALDVARANELLGDPEGVYEAGADRLDVEGGAARRRAKTRLEPARGGRIDAVRRRGPDHDELDVAGRHRGRLERAARGVLGKVAGRLAGGREPAFPDARPLPDPLVARVEPLGELVVGHHAFGQVAPGTRDAGEPQGTLRYESTASRCSLMRAGTSLSTSAIASWIALANEYASALPWLLTTVPRSPRKIAPL